MTAPSATKALHVPDALVLLAAILSGQRCMLRAPTCVAASLITTCRFSSYGSFVSDRRLPLCDRRVFATQLALASDTHSVLQEPTQIRQFVVQ
jgi:hypothetical protein